jgi:hypothetical protein
MLTAADELDDFEAIALCKSSFQPLGPRQNFQIPFNRDAPGVETEFTQQVHHGSAGFCGAIFSVHCNRDFHVHLSAVRIYASLRN